MLNTRFPRLPGDIGNPVSLTCPVLYETVDSASVPAVVSAYIDDVVVDDLVTAGQSLIARGAELLSTSCGFVCAIHDRLQARLSVPLVSSALNLVPRLCDEVAQNAPVGVLTFDARTLSREHFGRFWRNNVVMGGMQESEMFYPTIRFDHEHWCISQVERDVMAAADALHREVPNMCALLLECTNLSPWRDRLSDRLGLPVYDIHSAIARGRQYGPF